MFGSRSCKLSNEVSHDTRGDAEVFEVSSGNARPLKLLATRQPPAASPRTASPTRHRKLDLCNLVRSSRTGSSSPSFNTSGAKISFMVCGTHRGPVPSAPCRDSRGLDVLLVRTSDGNHTTIIPL